MAAEREFISLDGVQYTLVIDGVQAHENLQLSSDPFSTDEDGDTDMFVPVRTQSGYIRLKSYDNTTWRSYIPTGATSMPVKLMQGSTIVWQGYVQTGTYGTTWPAIYEDFELPIVCGLSVLESFDVDVQGPGDMVTVGQLLAYLFGKLSGLTYKCYFHTGNPNSNPAWLQYKVLWRNFLDEDDGTLKASYNCLEILEEICKFYGWSCRTHGDGIWFTSITDDERSDIVVVYTMQELAAGTTSTPAESFTHITLADADFASTDHSEEWIPGCKSVTFNSELNAFDTIVEVPKDELLKKYRNNNVTHGEHWKDHDANECYFQFKGALNYENALVKIKTFVEHESADDSEPQCFGRLAIFDTDMTNPKLRYNWTLSIDAFRSHDYGARQSSTPLIEIESKAAYILSDGILYINGKTDNVWWGKATCLLKIGNQYWNGTAWTSTASTFLLQCDSEGIEDTRTSINDTDYQGTGIPITTTLTGKIYFAIKDVESFALLMINLNGYFPLQDFEIGFVRRQQDSEANDLNYTATGGAFPEEVTVDSIFCTDKSKTEGDNTMRCEMGYGLLFSNTLIIDTIPYKTDYMKPEQHNANLIAAYGSTIRQVLTLQLWNSRVAASPKSIITLEGKRYFPVAISHHWRDGIQEVKLMEI